jgi:Ca-activated chloride channel family protein
MNELFGLISTSQHPVPLLGVKVEGYLLGRGAKLTIQQKFCNQEGTAIEAVYKFPLPENSAVAGFKAWIGERLIQSTIEEREKAFELYDKAMEKGHGAYLLDEERPNIFTLSVGNLNPGMEVVIEISLVMLLDTEGSKYRFTLPTTISPRYVPASMPDDNGIPATDIIHPEYAESVPYGLSLLLHIHHSGKLAAVESPSHPIKVNLLQDLVKVEFASETVQMDRDFILVIDPGETATSKAYRYDQGEYSYWQLDLALPVSEFPRPSNSNEIIFLLDCSGSMQGQSINEAKKALEICLKALKPGGTFNVYRFGSTFNSFFDLPFTYSEKSLNDALEQLEKTDANLGGTEIFAPLKEIFEVPPTLHERIIVLLTDGEIGNEQQVFELVAANKANLRFFPIGIGMGPNEYLIKGLARIGNGAAEFIHPGERIEPKVLRMFSRINIPRFDLQRVIWDGKEIEQAPVAPTVFAGIVITIFARGKLPVSDQNRLTVQGKIGEVQKEWHFEVVKTEPDNLPLPQLWARERIRDLEELDQSPGSQQRQRKESKNRDLVIALSKAYGIISRYTSLVGIEEREEKDRTTGAVQLRKVPAMITTGWHGMAGRLPMQAAPMRTRFSALTTVFESYHEKSDMVVEDEIITRTKEQKSGKTDILMALLAAQQVSGGFRIDEKLARILGIKLKKLEKLSKELVVRVAVDPIILLSTVLIFELLKMHFQSQTNIWQPVSEKSRIWLEDILQKGKPLVAGQDISEWSKEFVKKEVKMK